MDPPRHVTAVLAPQQTFLQPRLDVGPSLAQCPYVVVRRIVFSPVAEPRVGFVEHRLTGNEVHDPLAVILQRYVADSHHLPAPDHRTSGDTTLNSEKPGLVSPKRQRKVPRTAPRSPAFSGSSPYYKYAGSIESATAGRRKSRKFSRCSPPLMTTHFLS